jgi:hypothetical protein
MSRSVILGTLLVLVALLLPSVAAAQTQVWLADRRYTEGIGIKAGNFELHPGVAAEFGYDSNYFLRADKNPSENPVGALRFRLTPSFSLSTLSGARREEAGGSPPAVNFRAGIHATYDEFIPVSGPKADKDLMSKQRNIGGLLDFNLDLFPGRVVGGNLHGSLARSVEPSNLGDVSKSFNRIAPQAGGEIILTPNQGTFDWRLGYDFAGTIFESGTFSGLDNLSHEIKTRGRWRFLPRSALTFDGRFGFINYTATSTKKNGSHPLRARVGYNGLVTKSLAILAMGGWGASFYTPKGQEDFDSFIGQAELKLLLTPSPSNDPAAATLSLSALSVGFYRDFADSFIGTYYEVDRGYAKFSYFFAGRFLLVLDAGVGPVRFPQLFNGTTLAHAAWTDIRVDGSAFGEYRFANYFGVNATIRYSNNLSSTVLTGNALTGGTTGAFENLQWQDFQAFLGVRFMM